MVSDHTSHPVASHLFLKCPVKPGMVSSHRALPVLLHLCDETFNCAFDQAEDQADLAEPSESDDKRLQNK